MRRAVICLCFILGLAGCIDSNVDAVKNGTISGHEETTIAKAFEGTFDDAKWESNTSTKGYTTVCFYGTISQHTHTLAAAEYVRRVDQAKKELMNGTFPLSTHAKNQLFSAQKLLQQHYGKDVLEERILPLLRKAQNAKSQEVAIAAAKEYVSEILNRYFELIETKYWPVGTPVQFCWMLSQDKKSFQLESFSNVSWAEFGTNYEQVLQVVYAQ